MNNLQLFQMYQNFKQRQTIADYNYRPHNQELWADWCKWADLSQSAAEELERRLTPLADREKEKRQ